MVLEIKSICCMESLKKIPEIFGLENDNNWLSAVQYSLSTRTGTLVFAYETKVIVLSNKWDSRSHQSRYTITWSDELPLYDNITAVLCLPFANEAEDILAVILIGFTSGKFQLMTTRGHVIVSQQWYAEPVQSIQLPSDKKKTNDEIYVMYQTCVCILQSKQLIQSIRNLDKLGKTNNLLGRISCRVWKYGDSYGGRSETVTSSAVVGSKNIGLFDHLLAASYEGGFYAKYRSSAPQQLAVLSVGIKPFAAFYFAKEVVVQPLVSVALAQAVASTVKNALPSWLTGAQKTQVSAEPMPTITTESMILRYGFYDDHRIGNKIWLSPYNKLAAVADSLGRVLLVDCEQNVITRIWKGYRDAQCSFMKVDEKLSRNADRSKRKHALFLAIYSPKKSTVDIWNIERGKKLATFPAGQNGQLIQQYSHISAPNVSTSSMRSNSFAAFFLNPTDFTMKELTIPFHYALDISSNKKSKDLHVINQIKTDLKCCETEEEKNSLIDLCSSIQTNEMRFKCIHALIKNRYLTPEIFSLVLSTFLKTVEANTEIDRSDSDGGLSPKGTDNDPYSDMKLSKFLRKYERLLLFYNGMKQKNSHNDSSDSDEINDCDFDDILKVVDQYKMCLNLKRSAKVSIQSPIQSNSFIEYLSIFDCDSFDEIRLNESRSNRFAGVGFDLFNSFIRQTMNFDGFYKLAAISSLSNDDLLTLFLHYWMEKDIRYNDTNEVIRHLISFTQIVQTICDLNRASAEHNYGALSPWWQNIREMLLTNASVFKSLLAALLCRDLSVLYRQKEGQDSTGDEGVWEQVSQEIAQWSLLIGKLDDMAAMSSILSFKPTQLNGSQENTHNISILEYTIPDISLMAILNGGNGIVSELVAKWIASTGLKPNAFFSATEGEEVTENFVPNSSVSYVELLRKHFPFSLKKGVLLCQLAWEYASAWNKNVKKMELLATSIEYLDLFDEADFAMKHGICCIIWNSLFRKYIQSSVKLVNQIGKSSSSLDDSKNSSDFTDSMIPDFVLHCNKYLEHLIASKSSSPTVIIKFEELLQDGPVPALATHASQHSKANIKIIELHQQLLDVFLIFTSLNVSTKYPLNSLFNESAKAYLACDICNEAKDSILRTDDSVIKSRKHFLHRAINASVDLIRKDFHEIYLTDFNHWIDQILILGKRWTMNTDDLVKYQIIQLYTRGWDDCAEKKLTRTLQTAAMGKTLTSITATRLNMYAREKPELYSRVLSIGSRLNAFLETLDESSIRLPPQCEELEDIMFVEKLQRLARKAYECFTEQDGSDLKLAAHLFDACVEIRDYLISKKK